MPKKSSVPMIGLPAISIGTPELMPTTAPSTVGMRDNASSQSVLRSTWLRATLMVVPPKDGVERISMDQIPSGKQTRTLHIVAEKPKIKINDGLNAVAGEGGRFYPDVFCGIIPAQIFATFGGPVRQHPALNMNPIHNVVVGGRSMGMSVNQARIAKTACFILNSGLIDIRNHPGLRFITAPRAPPANPGGNAPAQPIGEA